MAGILLWFAVGKLTRSEVPNVADEVLAFLPRIREVSGSNVSPETSYPN